MSKMAIYRIKQTIRELQKEFGLIIYSSKDRLNLMVYWGVLFLQKSNFNNTIYDTISVDDLHSSVDN